MVDADKLGESLLRFFRRLHWADCEAGTTELWLHNETGLPLDVCIALVEPFMTVRTIIHNEAVFGVEADLKKRFDTLLKGLFNVEVKK